MAMQLDHWLEPQPRGDIIGRRHRPYLPRASVLADDSAGAEHDTERGPYSGARHLSGHQGDSGANPREQFTLMKLSAL